MSTQLDLLAAGDAVMIRSWAACSSLTPLFRAVWRNNRRLPRGMEGAGARGVGITIYLQRDINLSELWSAQYLPLPTM